MFAVDEDDDEFGEEALGAAFRTAVDQLIQRGVFVSAGARGLADQGKWLRLHRGFLPLLRRVDQ